MWIVCDFMDWPQDVTVVELHQHAVLAELGLPGAVDVTCRQIFVHFFQTLQALCHVLIVDLGVERWNMLLAEMVGAVHVEARALLDQRHGVWAAQALLGDVLWVRERNGWSSTCMSLCVQSHHWHNCDCTTKVCWNNEFAITDWAEHLKDTVMWETYGLHPAVYKK